MSLDKAGTLRYNLKYKRRPAGNGRSFPIVKCLRKRRSGYGAVISLCILRYQRRSLRSTVKVQRLPSSTLRSPPFLSREEQPFFTVCTLIIACVSYCVNQPSFQTVFIFAVRDGLMYPSFFCHKMQKTAQKGGLLTNFDCICYNRNGQVHIAVRPSVPFPLSAAGRRWRECGKRHFSFSYVQ